MDLHRYKVLTERFISDNSPHILTAVGVVGTISTAVLTGQATFKAADILLESSMRGTSKEVELNNKEKVGLVWRLYIPAIGVGSLTVVSIVGANRIGSRRAAALASAYAISDRAFNEYREKVIEKLGEKKEQVVRDEVAQDRVNRDSQYEKITLILDDTKVLCHDALSNQFFYSDMETLRKAQNDVNALILRSDYATVSDLYNYINADGLEETSVSGELGWNTDKFLEIEFTTVLYKDKTPCISMNFARVPVREPWRFC